MTAPLPTHDSNHTSPTYNRQHKPWMVCTACSTTVTSPDHHGLGNSNSLSKPASCTLLLRELAKESRGNDRYWTANEGLCAEFTRRVDGPPVICREEQQEVPASWVAAAPAFDLFTGWKPVRPPECVRRSLPVVMQCHKKITYQGLTWPSWWSRRIVHSLAHALGNMRSASVPKHDTDLGVI